MAVRQICAWAAGWGAMLSLGHFTTLKGLRGSEYEWVAGCLSRGLRLPTAGTQVTMGLPDAHMSCPALPTDLPHDLRPG